MSALFNPPKPKKVDSVPDRSNEQARKAAEKARARAQAGGRASTILTGPGVGEASVGRATLLGGGTA